MLFSRISSGDTFDEVRKLEPWIGAAYLAYIVQETYCAVLLGKEWNESLIKRQFLIAALSEYGCRRNSWSMTSAQQAVLCCRQDI